MVCGRSFSSRLRTEVEGYRDGFSIKIQDRKTSESGDDTFKNHEWLGR